MPLSDPLKIINDNNLINFRRFPEYISDYSLISPKNSGANNSGHLTGIYKVKVNGIIYKVLFKQGRNDAETICEHLAHKIYELIIPGRSSKTFFAVEKNHINSKFYNSTMHQNIYVSSIFFDSFQEIHKTLGYSERPRFLQTLHSSEMRNYITICKDTCDLEILIAAALWLGDYDVHIGNFGTINLNSNPRAAYTKRSILAVKKMSGSPSLLISPIATPPPL